jgi:acyl-CoA synthetase (AMP-forming)/AMP-acid ligase II
VIFQDAETLRSYTYAQVKTAAAEFGEGLRAIWDWQKGEVLALFSPNSIDIPVITWGTHWAGGVVFPANPTNTAGELAVQLKDTKSRVLATQLAFLPTAREAAKKVGIPADHIILIGDKLDPTAQAKHFVSIRNISAVVRYRKMRINPEMDLAFLAYSTGTTGVPKAVMLSHRNIVANVLQGTAGEGDNLSWTGRLDGKGDKVLAFLPFFHIYGK